MQESKPDSCHFKVIASYHMITALYKY